MDNRGQAYSAFKLLIAAVVAMAILGILMPIIMQVMGILTSDPTDEVIRLVNDLSDKPGTVRSTPKVTFQADGGQLHPKTLAGKSSLAPMDFCFSYGNIPESQRTEHSFQITPHSSDDYAILSWNGSQDKTTKIKIVCDNVGDDLKTYVQDDLDYELEDPCECLGTCCAIILQRS